MTKRPSLAKPETRHASCVALDGQAVLILGASGSGKSGLALHLIAFGAGLVADDRTLLWCDGDALIADAPDRLRGMIEARELGILRMDPVGPQSVGLIVDMDETEDQRLPERRTMDFWGCEIPVLRKSNLPHFPAAITTYLRGQRDV